MMSCRGLHCDGCGGGGGAGAVVVVLVGLAVGAALVHAAWPALVATLVLVAHVVFWTLGCLAAAAAIAGAAVLTVRGVRAHHVRRGHGRITAMPAPPAPMVVPPPARAQVTPLRRDGRATPTPRPALRALPGGQRQPHRATRGRWSR